jgi:hypothetical protein
MVDMRGSVRRPQARSTRIGFTPLSPSLSLSLLVYVHLVHRAGQLLLFPSLLLTVGAATGDVLALERNTVV